ncbi:MAG: hypothetical protein GWP91_22750 [Rhodobacterales bacterium]|nr:hypothetical protein [Rhodobacterales bacterium]
MIRLSSRHERTHLDATPGSMTAPTSKTFTTRFGTCTVHDGGIRLVNDAPRGQMSALITGQSIWTLRIVYALINLAAMSVLVTGFLDDGEVDPLLPFMVAYTAFALWRTMDHTRDMEISRDEIQQVTAFAGTRFLAVPQFVVRYTRDNGALKRIIQLPSVAFAQPEDFEAAKKIFVDSGLKVV